MESVVRRRWLVLGVLAFLGLSAAATAAYAWLAGPLLTLLDESRVSVSSQAFGGFARKPAALSPAEIAFLLVVLGVVRAVAESARARLSARLQLAVVREFRGEILRHLLDAEPSTLRRWPRGELASRIQVEVHGVRALLHLGLIQGIRSVVVATALATVAWRVDNALATPGLILVPLAAVLVVLAARPARRLQRGLFNAESALVARTAEAVDGVEVLRAYGASRQTLAAIEAQAALAEARGLAAATWSAVAAPLVELAGALGIAAVVALAWASAGPVDAAAVGTVVVALILMYRPLHGLAQATFGWWAGLGSLDRLDELFGLRAAQPGARAVRTEPVAALALEAVSFSFGEAAVFRDASAGFQAGELVAITGASGAGKSTLLALLAGSLTPEAGTLLIDGAPASRSELAAASAWLVQTPMMFGDTILHNIALGDEAPDRARAVEAARRAHAHDFVGVRPGGYEGTVEEGGANLSLGQRQRLSLARALYRKAPVWLLDEPTAALDEPLEHQVLKTCRAHTEAGGIVILATHRPSLLRCADRVLEVRDGKVRPWESTTRSALLN